MADDAPIGDEPLRPPRNMEVITGTGEGKPLPDASLGGEWVSIRPEHYAAAERLVRLVEDLLPDQNKQKRIDMSAALLDFYKTR